MRQVIAAIAVFLLGSSGTQGVETIRDKLYSPSMGREIDYVVVLPESYNGPGGKTFPVLYCLHGYGAPYDTWAVMQPLNQAIDTTHPAILVTFEGETSFYVDHPTDPGVQFGTFLLEELIPFIEGKYRAGKRVDLRGVTGFSMGGFGAWHYMLERPGFFCSVSSLSGAFNRAPNGQYSLNPYTRISAMADAGVSLPPTYLDCGANDSLLQDSRSMAAHLTGLGYSAVLIETPGYGHEWSFWRDVSDDLLKWHYQYFSDPVQLEFWNGYALYDGLDADTGDYLGWINTESAPWIWIYGLEKWVYTAQMDPEGPGGWNWFTKEEGR